MPSKKSSEQTKEKIKDAFLTLYEHNNIERISIQQISDLAGVNRATFYTHYTDIYDLLNQLEEEKFQILYGIISEAISPVIRGGKLSDYMPDINFFIENEKWVKILVGIYGKSNIIEKIKKRIKVIISENFAVNTDSAKVELDYALEYLVASNAAVLTKWVSNGMVDDVEKIKDIMSYSMLNGIINTLSKIRD